MTAGVEVVCGEVARKVEIEVNSSDLSGGGGVVSGDCDVGGGGSGNGGDSACVFEEVEQFKEGELGLGNEGVVVDPLVSETDVKGVNGDVNIVNESVVETPVVLVTNGVDVKSTGEVDGLTESARNAVESSQVTVSELEVANVDEVDQFKKEELGLENEGVVAEPMVSETDVKGVNGDVNIENGFVVEPHVVDGVDVDVNDHLDKVSAERDVDVKSCEEVDGLTESTQNTIESSEVTVSELAANVVEVDQFKKEELGLETEGIPVDPLVLEGNGVLHESTTVSAAEVKDVKDDVNLVNGSTVDPPVVLVTNGVDVDVNGHLDNISGEPDANVTESTQNTIKSSQVMVSELEADIKLSDVTVSTADYEVMVNDGPESVIKLVDNSECQVIVDESGKTSEDLEFQVTDDGSESSGSLIVEPEGQATVDVSGKPSEDLGSQVAADEPESYESPIKEQEREVSVDGSGSVGCLLDNQECLVSVDEPEFSANHTEKVESDTIVMESDGKLEEHQELLDITSEVNVEAENKKSEEDDALVNGQVEKFDRILVMGETQISGTEADGSSEKLVEVTESVEMEVNTEEIKEQVKVDDILESQTVVIDNVQDELNLEDNKAEPTSEAKVSLESDSQYGVSNCIEKPHLQPEASAENVETSNILESECNNSELLVQKDNDSVSNPDDLTVVEQKVEIVSDDGEKETAVMVVEDVPHPVPEIRSPKVMYCGAQVENVVVFDNEEKGTEVNDASVGDHSTLTFSETIVNHGVVIEFGSLGRHESIPSIQNKEVEGMNGIQSEEIPDSSIEGEEINDAIDAQNEEIEVLEYNFLVKIPRFEDENFRDQIRSAHALVVEKTRLRDSIRIAGQERRERLRVYNQEFEAAKQKEIAARRVVKAKRQEIEAVQAVINRWKNAMSVEDIDSRIYGVEYMIQHETLQLKDEKEFIREIRQLKSLRDQLASNMGTPEEIRHAIDMKDHNEKRLKVLRKELEDLKAEVSKVLAVLQKIVKKYEELIREERELQYQFRAADEVRQKAYAHLNSLRKLSYDKNTNFHQFKEDLTTAKTYLSQGDKDALHRLCANQVETFMEQWNNNDEFRQEYISRCNCIASRKQKALDGASFVPDDVAPVLPSNVIEKVDTSPVSLPAEVKHVAVVLPVDQEKGDSVSPTENKNTYNTENAYNSETCKPIENISGQKKQELKNKSVAKPTNLGSADGPKEIAEVAEYIPTKEEIESARKAEELKKEEIAKLKEQRRLEEKAKAVEALERKKRNAEKAQLRAELRARKEAEQKEKEREKRLRKKEKKTEESINEEAAGSENEATAKEIETAANKKKMKKPAAHLFSKQLKPKPAPVPPQVLNRNRRRWQQAGHVALAALAVLVVFMFANCGLFLGSKPIKFNYMRF